MASSVDLSTSTSSLPDSSSTSTFLRTAETLDGLAEQLGALRQRTASFASSEECQGCGRDRERMEAELALSAEIGQALLEKHEALVQKNARDKERADAKRIQLEELAANLERANTTHMQRYKEVTRANEALEKRLTQALHTQTLTQQSLTMVRTELTNLRTAAARQQVETVTSGRSSEAELEEMRDLKEAETRKAREEARKRKTAEGRVAALEEMLTRAKRETETVREGRAKDAQDLLSNAKERLEVLHSELTETFSSENPAGTPEFQKTLESLVASNALLKHDADELSGLLAESREEIRTLREEAEGGRSDGAVLERFDPRHNRTSSTPAARHGRGDSWTRYHMRKTSLTPSFASSGLGMGPIGDEEERVQTSPSSRSIGYQLNGIPKMPRRSYSERPKTARAFSGVAIAEWSGAESADEPTSPASDYPYQSMPSPIDFRDSGATSDGGRISPGLAQGPSPAKAKRVNRRTLLLLSRSQGVQTDPPIEASPNPNPAPSETSSLHERGSGALVALVEHMMRLLTRLRSADVPTLTKRLRKQHLPGDVSHLSCSTIKTLLNELNDLRSQFRADDTHVSRKEFILLVKLLKDVFADLIQMQGIINDVTINPAVAKEMRAKANAEEVKGASWAIINPLTKFFVTPTEDLPKPVERLQVPRMKQSASTLATTTHVNVEFAGTGAVRRATSSARTPLRPPDIISRAIPVSRTNKDDLRGIFAGSVHPTFQGPPPAAGVSRLRSTSSQHFKPAHRKRLSTVVDAVLDFDPSSFHEAEHSDEDDDDDEDVHRGPPPRMRPRGLSDSSIRSTFVSHGNSAGHMVPPAQRGVFETISRKFNPFAGAERTVSYTSTATGSSVPNTATVAPSSIGGRSSLLEDSKHA